MAPVKEKNKKTETKPEKKSARTSRFLGWQDTPIQVATFGRSTWRGRDNMRFEVKKSTGPVNEVVSEWYLLDASEAPVGRLATVAATLLMGKHRPTFTAGSGNVDGVIVINSDKAYFTSDKSQKKIYYWHTLYAGGLKQETAELALKRRPDEVIWMAVQGMMPKNKISRYELAHLKVYRGAEHPHKAQKPQVISLKGSAMKLKRIRTAKVA